MSTLFAFRTASPVPTSFGAELGDVYDPLNQTSTFESGTSLLAVHCTRTSTEDCTKTKSCNAYGSYCNGYGGYGRYRCDS